MGDGLATKTYRMPASPEAVAELRRTLVWVAVFSAVLTCLMLTGPIFMLQVLRSRFLRANQLANACHPLPYRRVSLRNDGIDRTIAAAVPLLMRPRILQDSNEEALFSQILENARSPQARSRPESAMQDLSTLQSFLASQIPSSLLDLPWTPLFCIILLIIHPALGMFSVAAALILAGLTLCNEIVHQESSARSTERPRRCQCPW